MELLRALARERGIAVVLSMHELDLAQKYADRLLCIRDGRVDRSGTPEEIFRGDYIHRLYGLTKGSYDCLTGTAEAMAASGTPRVFVLGGGGSGIPVYRRLRRLGIPFAAGVFPENDLDVPTAKALAAAVFTDAAQECVSEAAVHRAVPTLRQCAAVVCTCSFGAVNRENRKLLALAEELGLLCAAEELDERLEKA